MTATEKLSASPQKWLFNCLKSVSIAPVLLFFLVVGFHFLYKPLISFFELPPFVLTSLNQAEPYIYWGFLLISLYWLFVHTINKIITLVASWPFVTNYPSFGILLPFFSLILKIIFLLTLLNHIVQYLNIPVGFSYFLNKASSISIIAAITWILLKLVDVAGQLLVHYYTVNNDHKAVLRKIYTQTLILQRIAMSLIIVLAIGSVLILFDNVKALGASVLTTAGILGLVMTFTAQRSLSSFFSNLEIALTQPIKIGDSVIVNNESGTIEEINFRSVVVKLWDWRRMVVPTTYFLENSFYNLSRKENENLIGIVTFYVDFTFPVSELRAQLKEILSSCYLWDGEISSINVNELKESVMQLRILASAKTAADVANLCSELREKVISFIVKNYPESLPFERYYYWPNEPGELAAATGKMFDKAMGCSQ